jgi:hypothetical protein
MVIPMKRLLVLLALAAVLALAGNVAFRKRGPVFSARADQSEELLPPPSPALDEALWEERQFPDGPQYRINLSTATFLFDIESWADDDAKTAIRLWPSYRAAFDATESRPERFLTSLDVVVGLAKLQEDEMLGQVELALLPQTRQFFDLLQQTLSQRGQTDQQNRGSEAALAWASAGKALANSSTRLDSELASAVLQNFLQRRELSEPLSFYAESPDLTPAWRSQKFLTSPFADLFEKTEVTDDARWLAWAAIYRAIDTEKELERLFALLTRWSGTLEESAQGCGGEKVLAGLRRSVGTANKWQDPTTLKAFFQPHQPCFPGGLSVLPPATPVENLFVSLALQQRKGTMERVIKGLEQDPRFSAIQESSGWYARQRFALMPLIRPGDAMESYKLALTKAYRERLRKAFSASLTKARETHLARQSPFLPALSARKPQILLLKPELNVEPQATVFLRQAENARWLRDKMASQLEGAAVEAGRAAQELEALENRSLGLYCIAARNLGATNGALQRGWTQSELSVGEAAAREWLKTWPKSPLAKKDTRVAVPVVRSEDTITYWSTVGIQMLRLKVSFLAPPALQVEVNGKMQPAEWHGGEMCRVGQATVKVMPETFLIPADVFVEFTRSGKPLTRQEFQRILPRAASVERTKAALR